MTFQEVYDTYSGLIFNLALQYSQNKEDAEEITQNVFLVLYEKLNSFQGKSDIKTWIYRITINKSIDFLKAKKANRRSFLFSAVRLDDPEKHFEPSHFNHPGIILEEKETMAHIFKGINQLPEKQKTAIILLKIEQKTQAEAAQIMETSVKSIESLFQRAKKKLELFLNKTEGL